MGQAFLLTGLHFYRRNILTRHSPMIPVWTPGSLAAVTPSSQLWLSFQAFTEEVPIFLTQQIYSFQLLLETNAPCHAENSPLLRSALKIAFYLIYPRFHRFISDRSASNQMNHGKGFERQFTHTFNVTVRWRLESSHRSHLALTCLMVRWKRSNGKCDISMSNYSEFFKI